MKTAGLNHSECQEMHVSLHELSPKMISQTASVEQSKNKDKFTRASCKKIFFHCYFILTKFISKIHTAFQLALLRGPSVSHFFLGLRPRGRTSGGLRAAGAPGNIGGIGMPPGNGGGGGPIPGGIGGGGGPPPGMGGGGGQNPEEPGGSGGGGGAPPAPGMGGGGGQYMAGGGGGAGMLPSFTKKGEA